MKDEVFDIFNFAHAITAVDGITSPVLPREERAQVTMSNSSPTNQGFGYPNELVIY